MSPAHSRHFSIENPLFESKESKVTCRVRVCRDGFDSVIELHLLDGQWQVLGESMDAEGRASIAAFVADEYAKAGHGAATHRRLTSERSRD